MEKPVIKVELKALKNNLNNKQQVKTLLANITDENVKSLLKMMISEIQLLKSKLGNFQNKI